MVWKQHWFPRKHCENTVFDLFPEKLLFQGPCNSSVPAASIVSNEFHTHFITPKSTRDQVLQQMTVDLATESRRDASYLEFVQKLPGSIGGIQIYFPRDGHQIQGWGYLFPMDLKHLANLATNAANFFWDLPLLLRHKACFEFSMLTKTTALKPASRKLPPPVEFECSSTCHRRINRNQKMRPRTNQWRVMNFPPK